MGVRYPIDLEGHLDSPRALVSEIREYFSLKSSQTQLYACPSLVPTSARLPWERNPVNIL